MMASVALVTLVTLGFVSAAGQNVWHQDQGKAFLSAMLSDRKLPQDFFNLFKLKTGQRDWTATSTDDPLLSLLEGLKFQHKGKKVTVILLYDIINSDTSFYSTVKNSAKGLV